MHVMGSNSISFANHTNLFSSPLLHPYDPSLPSAFRTNLPKRRGFHASDRFLRPLPTALTASNGAHAVNSVPVCHFLIPFSVIKMSLFIYFLKFSR